MLTPENVLLYSCFRRRAGGRAVGRPPKPLRSHFQSIPPKHLQQPSWPQSRLSLPHHPQTPGRRPRGTQRAEETPEAHTTSLAKASHQSIPQHLQRPSYYIAATSRSTLQNLRKSPKITENHRKSHKNHQFFHLQRPSYNLAATSRSTTLQNHRKSLKITKNTQKSSNFP